jgi:hypothetical protein
MLTQYMTYIKFALIIVVLVLVGGLYLGLTHYKSKVDTLNVQILALQQVNKESKQSFDKLKNDLNRASKLCQNRLDDKDKIIAELDKLNHLTEGGNVDESGIIYTGNAVFDSLNGMYPQTGSTGRVCNAASSSTSTASSGQSGEFLYCLTREEAIKLMRNKTLHDSREYEMELELKSFKTTSK